jgi:hypothetical protein
VIFLCGVQARVRVTASVAFRLSSKVRRVTIAAVCLRPSSAHVRIPRIAKVIHALLRSTWRTLKLTTFYGTAAVANGGTVPVRAVGGATVCCLTGGAHVRGQDGAALGIVAHCFGAGCIATFASSRHSRRESKSDHSKEIPSTGRHYHENCVRERLLCLCVSVM